MKFRFSQVFSAVFVLILAACSTIGQAPATQTSIPSVTPLPTNTPVPTATSTPVPSATSTSTPMPSPTLTATPDMTGTEAVKNTQTAAAIVNAFKSDLSKVDVTIDKGHMGWTQQDSVVIPLKGKNDSKYQPFAEDLKASDFVITTDMIWTAPGIIICGWIFRSEPNFAVGQQYMMNFLHFSGLPGWDIELWNYGQFQLNISEKVRFASALNHFTMLAEGNKFTLYINEQRIGSFYDYNNTRTDGYFAFEGSIESGEGSCTYENTRVWILN